jgi:hypothetical protein
MPLRFRLTEPIAPETALHEAVAKALDHLLLPPAVWTTFPAGSVPLPPQFAVKLYRMGLKRGIPDILVWHRTAYGIELKKPGETLSISRTIRNRRGQLRYVEGQRDMFPKLEAAGMRIAVCRNVTEVLHALADWQIPLRPHAL